MIRCRRDVHFWIQTKRAERMADHMPEDWGDGWENVTLCVTTENQKRAEERLPLLLAVPAAKSAFLSDVCLFAVDTAVGIVCLGQHCIGFVRCCLSFIEIRRIVKNPH